MENRLILFFCFFTFQLSAQNMTRSQYIDQYKDEAIYQMRKYKIPASITLAQGILESANGNSELANKSNNHFGIKCHSDWEGERVFHDDDKNNECFRKYDKVRDSIVGAYQQIKIGAVLDAVGRGKFAMSQCANFLDMLNRGEVNDGDIIFLQDYWHPGIESILYAIDLYGIDLKFYSIRLCLACGV